MHRSRILASLTIVVFLLVAVCVSIGDDDRADDLGRSLAGTWERTLAGNPSFRAVKIVNRTHFMFAIYDTKSGQSIMVGGGFCQFEGKKYIETLEFGSPQPGPLALVGKRQEFTATVNGNEWLHEGTLSTGVGVKEIWKRVTKPRPNLGNIADSTITRAQAGGQKESTSSTL